MANRSIRDQRQSQADTSKRAGAPGRGSLFGKKKPPAAASSDPATRDLSLGNAAGNLRKLKRSRLDEVEDI